MNTQINHPALADRWNEIQKGDPSAMVQYAVDNIAFAYICGSGRFMVALAADDNGLADQHNTVIIPLED